MKFIVQNVSNIELFHTKFINVCVRDNYRLKNCFLFFFLLNCAVIDAVPFLSEFDPVEPILSNGNTVFNPVYFRINSAFDELHQLPAVVIYMTQAVRARAKMPLR